MRIKGTLLAIFRQNIIYLKRLMCYNYERGVSYGKN